MDISKIQFGQLSNSKSISQSFEDLDIDKNNVINTDDLTLATSTEIKDVIANLLTDEETSELAEDAILDMDELNLEKQTKTDLGTNQYDIQRTDKRSFNDDVTNSKGTVYVVMGNTTGCGYSIKLEQEIQNNANALNQVATVYDLDWNSNNELCWNIYKQGSGENASSAKFPQIAKFVDGKFVELISNPRNANQAVEEMINKAKTQQDSISIQLEKIESAIYSLAITENSKYAIFAGMSYEINDKGQIVKLYSNEPDSQYHFDIAYATDDSGYMLITEYDCDGQKCNVMNFDNNGKFLADNYGSNIKYDDSGKILEKHVKNPITNDKSSQYYSYDESGNPTGSVVINSCDEGYGSIEFFTKDLQSIYAIKLQQNETVTVNSDGTYTVKIKNDDGTYTVKTFSEQGTETSVNSTISTGDVGSVEFAAKLLGFNTSDLTNIKYDSQGRIISFNDSLTHSDCSTHTYELTYNDDGTITLSHTHFDETTGGTAKEIKLYDKNGYEMVFKKNKLYINNKLANGVYNDKLYQQGSVVNKRTVKGIYYIEGKAANGTYNRQLYVDGKLANGEIDGVMYKNGIIVNKRTINQIYYINGKAANGTYNSRLYIDGKLANGLVDDLMYKSGKLFTGKLDGKIYKKGVDKTKYKL